MHSLYTYLSVWLFYKSPIFHTSKKSEYKACGGAWGVGRNSVLMCTTVGSSLVIDRCMYIPTTYQILIVVAYQNTNDVHHSIL